MLLLNKMMAKINKKLMFLVLIDICVINCNGETVQKISRTKCVEYGNLIKSKTCIESSSTEGAAESGDFPHMAAIGHNKNADIRWMCAGVLISEQYILTAAHCVTNQIKPSIVRLGDINLKLDSDNTLVQDIKISNISTYQQNKVGYLYNDIALIKLEKPAQLNQYVRPACLPDVNDVIDFTKQKFIKSGWGLLPKVDQEPKPYLLYNKKIVTVPYETCKTSYPSFTGLENGLDQNTHICIGPHNEECQIISGSPIQIKDKEVECMQQIIGLLSFASHRCLRDSPEVLTKVSPYIDWIEKIVWA